MLTLTVRDIMTSEVVTVFERDSMEMAEQTMHAARVHHLPVLSSSGRLVGVLSHCDVLRATMSCIAEPTADEETAIKQSIPVAMLMRAPEGVISPTTSVRRAARLLSRFDYGCLPVVENGQLIGLVTKGAFVDLVDRLLDEDSATPGAFEEQGHFFHGGDEARREVELLGQA